MASNPVTNALRVTYTPEIALEICTLIADGEPLTRIVEREGMPSRATIYRWLSVYPKFFDAFERALEVSALSLEERALAIAQQLIDKNDYTNTKVSALNYAMQQLRWSASRRDKARYGQATAAVTSVIPIQINTTLNLGQPGQPEPKDNEKSIYTIDLEVKSSPGIVEDEDESVMELHASGEVLELEPASETEPLAFGLPESETQQLHNPPNGRPPRKPRVRKGHKSPGATARTAKTYAKKEATK